MTSISEAYRRAMAKKGAEAKRLKDANKAFGGQDNRLEAMYGIHKPNPPATEEKTVDNGGEKTGGT